MRLAIAQLGVVPDVLLNDAVTIPQVAYPQVPIIKGDAKSVSIAAASILAKVTRDRLMIQYDEILPGYGFGQNKGYGSKEHIQAAKSVSIAAASILAKVTRDRLMIQYDEILPGYGFGQNKGYGSKEHIQALQKMGPTPIHRRSFITHFI